MGNGFCIAFFKITIKRKIISNSKERINPNTKIEATTECKGIIASLLPPLLRESSINRITTAIIKQQLHKKTILENVRMGN